MMSVNQLFDISKCPHIYYDYSIEFVINFLSLAHLLMIRIILSVVIYTRKPYIYIYTTKLRENELIIERERSKQMKTK